MNSDRRIPPWVWLLLTIPLVVLYLVTAKWNEPEVTEADKFRYMAQELIKKQMIAPSTTDFAPENEWTITKVADNKYRLAAWYESKNAFGVPLRKTFDVTLAFDGVENWWLDPVDK